MNEFLQEEYYHNTVLEYCIALMIILVGLVIVRIIKRIILIRLIKFSDSTKGNFDNYIFNSITVWHSCLIHYSGVFWP